MEEPLLLNCAKLETAQIILRVLRYSPSLSLQDEGMVTAREPPEEANTEEQHIKVVRQRRHIREIRFIPIMRPMQRSCKRAVTHMVTNLI